MKIKMIFPGRPIRPLEIRSKNHLIPSETLIALAAVTPANHEVEIHDENVRPINTDDFPDLVVITVYTFLAIRAYEIADIYRSKGVRVALGGLHVTGMPEEAQKHADTIFIGEADYSWPEFLKDLESGYPKPVYQQTKSTDISAIPRPRRDLLDVRRYLSTASVTATRGCPYSCAYCFNSVNKNYSRFRTRPVESVIDEIKKHMKNGHSYIVFFDDNLMVDKEYGRELCRALIPLNIRWRCASSIELGYDEDTIRLMADAGCESIFIGLESIYKESLHESSKYHNHSENYHELIHTIHRNGIMINASFVFGFDHDDPDVFENTVKFAVDAKLASINFHIVTPYPGTPLFKKLESENRIITYDWSKYDTAHAVFKPARMSPEELEYGYKWVYKEFYSWPNILKRMPEGLTQKPRFLAFNVFLKKANPLWEVMIKANVLEPAFKTYHAIDRVIWKAGRMKEKAINPVINEINEPTYRIK